VFGISAVVCSHSTMTEIFPSAGKKYHDQHVFPRDSNCYPNKLYVEASIPNESCERYIIFRGVILLFPCFTIFKKYNNHRMSADGMK
jgi:hypothetical protein